MWLICLAVDSSGFWSGSICLALEELGAAWFHLSIIYFRIEIDCSAWLHQFDKWLNCSWREATLCRKRLISAQYLSLIMRFWSLILISRILYWFSKICCWALNSSNSACRSTQCKQSSSHAIFASRGERDKRRVWSTAPETKGMEITSHEMGQLKAYDRLET